MLESILLVLSLCIDALIASFAYGTNKIKIPFTSLVTLTVISTLSLVISMSFGFLLQNYLTPSFAHISCFILLFCLGFLRFFEGVLKNFLRKKSSSTDYIEVNLLNFKLVLNVYANATLADLDHSKVLTLKESIYLGLALSLDSLLIGLGAALEPISLSEVILFSILFNLIALKLGELIGKTCSQKTSHDLSWLGGVLLILLAFIKLI